MPPRAGTPKTCPPASPRRRPRPSAPTLRSRPGARARAGVPLQSFCQLRRTAALARTAILLVLRGKLVLLAPSGWLLHARLVRRGLRASTRRRSRRCTRLSSSAFHSRMRGLSRGAGARRGASPSVASRALKGASQAPLPAGWLQEEADQALVALSRASPATPSRWHLRPGPGWPASTGEAWQPTRVRSGHLGVGHLCQSQPGTEASKPHGCSPCAARAPPHRRLALLHLVARRRTRRAAAALGVVRPPARTKCARAERACAAQRAAQQVTLELIPVMLALLVELATDCTR